MPKRHGISLTEEKEIRFQLGIWRAFDPWTDGSLIWVQGYKELHPEKHPLNTEYHFRRVFIRLSICLSRLYCQIREYDKFIEQIGIENSELYRFWDIQEDAGIIADSVFHYLNLFIDDIARIIPFILDEPNARQIMVDHDSASFFNYFKKRILNRTIPANQKIIDLFRELENPNSWYYLGFQRGDGIRQRLVHYTSLLSFSASTKPNEERMTADVKLIEIGTSEKTLDFEPTLKSLLYSLCEWLDELEELLSPILSETLAKKGVQWSMLDHPIKGYTLPNLDSKEFDRSSFYLPWIKD